MKTSYSIELRCVFINLVSQIVHPETKLILVNKHEYHEKNLCPHLFFSKFPYHVWAITANLYR